MCKHPSFCLIIKIELKKQSEMSIEAQTILLKYNLKIFILPKDKIIFDTPPGLIFLLYHHFVIASGVSYQSELQLF